MYDCLARGEHGGMKQHGWHCSRVHGLSDGARCPPVIGRMPSKLCTRGLTEALVVERFVAYAPATDVPCDL